MKYGRLLWLAVCVNSLLCCTSGTRLGLKDPRAVRKVLTDNTGIIEWILEHIQEAIDVLEKGSTVDAYECLVGMAYVLQDTAGGKMWALSMIDSSAKIPSGLLGANFNDFGIYDECIAIVNPNPEIEFTGMHCLVDFKISVPQNMTLEIDGTPTSIVTLLGSNVITITLGHCYPSVCSPAIIQGAYNLLVGRVGNWTGNKYGLEVAIDPTDCHLSERGALQTSEWLVLMFIAMILFMAGLSTAIDLAYFRHALKNRRPNAGEQAAIAFSLYSNGKKLISLDQGSDSITILNGLKFISIGWVVLGHRYRYLINEPITNLIDIAAQIKRLDKMIILSAPLAVDTFFMISGLLNSFIFMKVRAKKRKFTIVDIIISYIHRFVRLTPAYAMAIAITATLLYRLGNGPEWDRIIRPVQNDCKDGWWWNILYVNNYGIDNYCMLQSWYLSADMQMFWASPFVVYPLWRWPIVGYVELILLLIASIIAPFYTAWYYEIAAPIPTTTDEARKNLEMAKLYLPAYTKFTSYVIGIYLGYVIYKIRNRQWQFNMNRTVNMALWATSAGFMLLAVFGGHPMFQLDYVYNKWLSSTYIGSYRLFWGLGLAWIILACDNGWGGPVNRFLSWNIFGPLGRLTYCIYLVHVGVMLVGVGSTRNSIYYSDFFQAHSFLGDMVLCVAVAAAFSLLMESPLMILEKLVFAPSSRPRKRVEPVEIASDTEAIIPSAPPINHAIIENETTSLKRPSIHEESTDL
ncbi:transferase activity, transferring acyl groups other than amino-acyl groups [Nesidiocoris tenuis]|uniref:Transferase activity, transferring acyl groups other than amino-acyl groups n=1 Tax=Nesidiocoris tenuis TaxID=355587 RepID=A0ABN7BA64_9HEMI|nr:transferase activity, transferring acyl groups other than amino-acyl groups [Nesidiocoris tenuis]